jgi:hypothetical protein
MSAVELDALIYSSVAGFCESASGPGARMGPGMKDGR